MSQPTKDRQFQFTQTVEDAMGPDKAGLPDHLKKPEFLSSGTKEALAAMERGSGSKEEVKPAEEPGKLQIEVVDEGPPAPKAPSPVEDLGAAEEDFMDFRNQASDILQNEELRKVVESRCKPISIDELITSGRCIQRVPVVPESFEPTFQTVTGEEDLFVKGLFYREKGSDMFVHQKFTTMNLAMGLVAINDTQLPSIRNGEELDAELFLKKFGWVQRLPTPMLVSLQVNYFWFDERARKMFSFRTV